MFKFRKKRTANFEKLWFLNKRITYDTYWKYRGKLLAENHPDVAWAKDKNRNVKDMAYYYGYSPNNGRIKDSLASLEQNEKGNYIGQLDRATLERILGSK